MWGVSRIHHIVIACFSCGGLGGFSTRVKKLIWSIGITTIGIVDRRIVDPRLRKMLLLQNASMCPTRLEINSSGTLVSIVIVPPVFRYITTVNTCLFISSATSSPHCLLVFRLSTLSHREHFCSSLECPIFSHRTVPSEHLFRQFIGNFLFTFNQ